MKIKQKLIKELLYEIDVRQRDIDSIARSPVDLIAECFPQARVNLWGHEIDFWLPYSFELIETVKQFMNEQTNYTLAKEHQTVGTNSALLVLRYLLKDEIKIEINFSTSEEGTTCVLNQIGETVIPESIEPIYEVICTKGAEEGSF